MNHPIVMLARGFYVPRESALTVDAEREFVESKLSTIQRYAGKRLAADDVIVRGGFICNTKRDYYYSRFTPDALNEVAELLPGRPVLDSHNTRSRILGRFFEAEVVKRQLPGWKARDSQWVKGLFYTANDAEGQRLANRVDLGLDAEMSLGWSCAEGACNICGQDIMECGHIPGDIYEGRGFCEYAFAGILSAVEASVVYAGGQKGTATFNPTDADGRSRDAVPWCDIRGLKDRTHRVLSVPLNERGLLDMLFGNYVPGVRSRVHRIELSKSEFPERAAASAWSREHGFRVDRYVAGETVHGFDIRKPMEEDGARLTTVRLDDGVKALFMRSAKDASRAADDASLDELFATQAEPAA